MVGAVLFNRCMLHCVYSQGPQAETQDEPNCYEGTHMPPVAWLK